MKSGLIWVAFMMGESVYQETQSDACSIIIVTHYKGVKRFYLKHVSLKMIPGHLSENAVFKIRYPLKSVKTKARRNEYR